jgi:hypothetical protein
MRGHRDSKVVDIVRALGWWEGHDDVPKELSDLISQACDEIRGLRADVERLRKDIEAAELRF